MNAVEIIARKRDRRELTEKQIRDMIEGFCDDAIPDYQMSAWLMAILLNGMTGDETVALTRAMLESGTRLQWNSDLPLVDKHSTGGIGDKVSIPLAPMLACCGVRVPMISGRGLGPTGGTLDKLESISGFRTNLNESEIKSLVDRVGCVITGATAEIAPADQRLYALRDVTGTVESIPLITASILSKKLAAGLDALVLDVKFGSGAFMKSWDQAVELAKSLVTVGTGLGVPTTALLTDMNQTLGHTAGNAIEIRESLEMLQGQGADDLVEVSLELGAHLLTMVNGKELQQNCARLESTLQDGSASRKFQEMVVGQGGGAFDYQPEFASDVTAATGGFLHALDARQIGLAIIELGGGRKVKGDVLDLGVGIEQVARVGDALTADQPVFRIISDQPLDSRKTAAATELLRDAIRIADQAPERQPLVREVITPESIRGDRNAG